MKKVDLHIIIIITTTIIITGAPDIHHDHHHDYHHDHHHHDYDDAKRWVCTSGRPEDLATTDRLAKEVLEQQVVQHDHDDHHDHDDDDENAFKVREGVPKEIEQQICDNIKWIRLSFPFFCGSFLLSV